ncbi:putative hydrolase [Sphingobium sp. SYK-6]|uniref:amidohydrolase family protein n=1 Tax=Sphingobium sp. (strain NBRC 103272 / SYK-6) TaxID=627192 RepID=UPI0002276647|nr:amidohydrolase family protein [Sphingobium sp. SYK-6]BAK65070.1 putative hydrolase [Sphingobium sp. SYK-6]
MTTLPRIAAFVAAATFLAAGLPATAQLPAKAAEAVLYTHATLIDGTGAPARKDQDILVRGERIEAVGPSGTLDAARTGGARTVDLSGRHVMPGLIDSHVHLATPPNRGRAEAMLRRQLYGGVTAVRDMADDLRAVGELSRASLAGEMPAPDIFYAALMAGPSFFEDPRVLAVSLGKTPGTAPWMQAIDDKTDLRTAVTLAKGTSATAIKIYANLPASLIAGITQEAHRQGMMIWAHSAVFPTWPADVIAAGPDSLSHVCYLAYQTQPAMLPAYEDRTPVDERRLAASGDDPVLARLFAAMLERGAVLDATGSLFVLFEEERRNNPAAKPLRCTGPATTRLTRQAWQAGVPISAGTDFVHKTDDPWPALFDELHFLQHDVGMPPLEVIRAATLIGARAAGQEKEMGSIEPGKLANFIVLTADPLQDIDHVRSIETTVKRGRAYRRADYTPVTKAEMGGRDED